MIFIFIKVLLLLLHLNDNDQENFELSQGCYVKGWGKDVFGAEGEYQVIFPKGIIGLS